jgi:hypothetical protein
MFKDMYSMCMVLCVIFKQCKSQPDKKNLVVNKEQENEPLVKFDYAQEFKKLGGLELL